MSNIKPGCTAITIKSEQIQNIGKIVKVGSFIGFCDGFKDSDHWEVNQPMIDNFGYYVNFFPGSQLQRIDDHKEKQRTKSSQRLKV